MGGAEATKEAQPLRVSVLGLTSSQQAGEPGKYSLLGAPSAGESRAGKRGASECKQA